MNRIFDPNKGYFIWIGSYVEVPNDINKINLYEYLFKGSIRVFELTDYFSMKTQYSQFGGTVLQYSAHNLMFVKFAPYGTSTSSFFERTNELLAPVPFTEGSFSRVEEKHSKGVYKHISVKRSDLSYVACYGDEVDDYSVRMIDGIMLRLNNPEDYADELAIHIDLCEKTDNPFTFTNKDYYKTNS